MRYATNGFEGLNSFQSNCSRKARGYDMQQDIYQVFELLSGVYPSQILRFFSESSEIRCEREAVVAIDFYS